MTRRLLLLTTLFICSFILVSCVQPSPPKVEYQNYEISRVTTQGIDVDFYFDVENENPLPVDVTKYSYKVYINNKLFLSEDRSGFSIPASSKKRITITVNIKYERLFGTALSIVERMLKGIDSIDYRIEGSLTAGTLGINATAPLKASGTIPIPKDLKL